MVRAVSEPLIGSQNSPKAVLLCWHKLKGEGRRRLGGGRRENSGKAMNDDPCSSVRRQGGMPRYTTRKMDTAANLMGDALDESSPSMGRSKLNSNHEVDEIGSYMR